MSNNNNGDGLMWGVVILLALIYWIVMFIIEYFVFFLILGLVIWAIYYYTTNAPKWEHQEKLRTIFASNYTSSHTNFKDLYSTAQHNIKVLGYSCFALPNNGNETELYNLSFKKDIAQFSNKLKSVSRYLVPPHKLYNNEEGAANDNPYISATKTVVSLIDKTIKIPNTILSLEKRCISIRKKEISSPKLERFYNILVSISSSFTIDDYRRLHLTNDAELVERDKESKFASSVNTTEA